MIRPTLFTDVDDVLVLRRTVDFNKHAPVLTDDICRRLLHPPAMEVLAAAVAEGASLVITSNWCRFLDKEDFSRLFEGGGYPAVGSALHASWNSQRAPSGTRRMPSIAGSGNTTNESHTASSTTPTAAPSC